MMCLRPLALLVGMMVALGSPARADAVQWLCRPGIADACAVPLSVTVAGANGAVTRRTFRADPHAPIDCFYVYPTVSVEIARNSDLKATSKQRSAVKAQFARFGTVCRLFAPLYRQVTDIGLLLGGDRNLAYADVLGAWRSYLSHDNRGRGVVLIGHSQGASVLKRLVAEQIDGKPVQTRLVSALLIGAAIDVPAGKTVGGTFAHLPLCVTRRQTGCIIAYSSYLANAPPGRFSPFGKSTRAGVRDACVNPAQLDGSTTLDADLPVRGQDARDGSTFSNVTGVLSARCTWNGRSSYLAISSSDDPRGAHVERLLRFVNGVLPGWGLHLLDVNLALENLVDIVGAESRAYQAGRVRTVVVR